MSDNPYIEKYIAYLRFELGLSPNSCDAYSKDVKKLLSWLEVEHIELEQVSILICNIFYLASMT